MKWLRQTRGAGDGGEERAQWKGAASRRPKLLLRLRRSACPALDRRVRADYGLRTGAGRPCIPRPLRWDLRRAGFRESSRRKAEYPGSRIRFFPAANRDRRDPMEFRYREWSRIWARTSRPAALPASTSLLRRVQRK